MSQQITTIQAKKNVPFELEYNPKFLPAGFQFISKRVDNKWRITPLQDGVVPVKMPVQSPKGKAAAPINIPPAKAPVRQANAPAPQHLPARVTVTPSAPTAATSKAQKSDAIPTAAPTASTPAQAVLEAQRRKEELLRELARLEQIVGK